MCPKEVRFYLEELQAIVQNTREHLLSQLKEQDILR